MIEQPDATNIETPEAQADQAAQKDAADRKRLEQLLDDQYFARKKRSEIGAALLERADQYYTDLQKLGKLRLWKRAYDYFYMGEKRGGALARSGKQNEFVRLPVNHYRNIIKHLLNGVTSQPPSPEPQAQNTDFDSMSQTVVSRGVINYYDRDKRINRFTKLAAEMSLLYGEGDIEEIFDTEAGNDYMVDGGGGVVKEGDLEFWAMGPIDVVRDLQRDSSLGHDWKMVRRLVNKYTYAARYPAFADKILAIQTNFAEKRNVRLAPIPDGDSDLIYIWRFYHEKTAALPEGRIVELASPDVVTVDGPLPYRRVTVYRIAPDEKDGTGLGYTIGFDILPIQEAADSLYSTIATNQANFGVQNIAMPKQANLSITQISDGLNLIEYDIVGNVPLKPEGLNLVDTPAEIFNFLDKLEKAIETISGVNATVRGNPEASLKSGAALALVSSMAIQFNSDFQQSYAQLLEDVWTGIIEILQDFSSTPRMARITGKANRPLMSSFKKEDINKIQRVAVELGNPLMRTTAGKLQIAEDLLSKGLIKTPDEYITLLTTGRLEPLIEGQQSQLLLVRAENERLGDESEQVSQQPAMGPDGMPQVDPATGLPQTEDVSSVPVIITDDHALHMQEHASVLASPEARQNPIVVRNTLAHMAAHIKNLMSGDPILMLTGQPSLAPPPGPEPTNQKESGGGEAQGKGKGAPSAAAVADPTNAVAKSAATVNQPNMPTNPLSGQKFEPQSGGLQ